MAATTSLNIGNEMERFLEQELNKDLLRFTTAGSVDDGKSTLIGRLLHDCKAIYEDQLDSIKKSRINRSGKAVDFSLLTDGLRAEREQGITIDVAYRYFSTARRKFIIADTPGHEEYTRNMATGASTSDLAVILIDATKGLLPQTRRHTYIASLLGISSTVAAINKMDLVDYQEEVFLQLEWEFSELARALGIPAVQCVPICALDGDNVVLRSEKTPWYSGPTLLEHLESVPAVPLFEMRELRFPVQSVVRPDNSFRGFAGRITSGTVRLGDEVLALPSKQKTRVKSIVSFDGEMELAGSSESVVLELRDEIDLGRGDLLVSPDRAPHLSNRFSTMVVWLHATPMELNKTYLAKHAGRQVKLKATRIRYRMDVNELTEQPADHLEMNEIACVEFEATHALSFDPYKRNRTMGSLILIDALSNATVGAVMIREDLGPKLGNALHTDDFQRDVKRDALEEQIRRRGHRPAIFVLNGERALAEQVERDLLRGGFETALIHQNEIPTGARRAFFAALWKLGLVIIAWASTRIRPREKGLFAEIASESMFDLSPAQTSANAEGIRCEAMRIAETLRVARNGTHQEEN